MIAEIHLVPIFDLFYCRYIELLLSLKALQKGFVLLKTTKKGFSIPAYGPQPILEHGNDFKGSESDSQ